MKNTIVCLLVLCLGMPGLFAQSMDNYEKHIYVKGNDSLPYRLLLPQNYDATKSYPIVFILHGAGERGNDNEKQLVHGGNLFLIDSIRAKYPAIVVFPQCPATSYWSNVNIVKDSTTGKRTFNFNTGGKPTLAMDLLQKLFKKIAHDYPVNKHQVYVGGLSMGGMGTYELVRRNNKKIAAAFAICGGAEPATAREIKKVKWRIFHGAKDDVVPPEFSIKMNEALKAQDADVALKIYPNANHNSWDSTFAEPWLLSWLFAQKR